MEIIENYKDIKNLFLEELNYRFLDLDIILSIGEVDKVPSKIDLGNKEYIENVHSVKPGKTKLRIFFKDIISCKIEDESFIVPDKDELYEGNKIRLYRKSEDLQYIKNKTIFFNLFSNKEIFHFKIITCDEVISVIVKEIPLIEKFIQN